MLVLPYELFDRNKALFLYKLGEFVGNNLSELNLNFQQRINAKKNHYLTYKLKFLNPFLYSNSVNNHSGVFNSFSRNIIVKGKNALANVIPSKFNEDTKNRLFHIIKEWTDNRFNKSNKITSELTGINLEEFGYPISDMKVSTERGK